MQKVVKRDEWRKDQSTWLERKRGRVAQVSSTAISFR